VKKKQKQRYQRQGGMDAIGTGMQQQILCSGRKESTKDAFANCWFPSLWLTGIKFQEGNIPSQQDTFFLLYRPDAFSFFECLARQPTQKPVNQWGVSQPRKKILSLCYE
jgi:hypothetical protein